MNETTKKTATHEVDVEDFNPKPIPEGELQQLLATAPDYVKKRAAEWAKQREEMGGKTATVAN